jgi:hypothetical protein
MVHMGIIKKRSIYEYWSTDPYIITPIFHSPNYLSRNRFLFILRQDFLFSILLFYRLSLLIRFLRFADYENLVADDRLQRIRPYLDQVRDICMSKYIPSRNIAVDETLLLYKGRLVCWCLFIDSKFSCDLLVIQTIQSSKKSSFRHQDFCFM